VSAAQRFDVVVLGAGPAGQKAAVQAAKSGRSVALVEREAGVGGECVRRGTIPSKTLRETALFLSGLRERAGDAFTVDLGPGTKVRALMQRLDRVLAAHERFQGEQVRRNGIELLRGLGSFRSPHEIEVARLDGTRLLLEAGIVVIATGSRPRAPEGIPIDHERILDSDSILDLLYLPKSLLVLGAGVIAAEFASIFQALGVSVTMIDRGPRPVSFLDPELSARFTAAFEAAGGRFLPGRSVARVSADDFASITAVLDDGSRVSAEKLLVAQGRVAALENLALERAGLAPNARGFVGVDEHCRTALPHVYAVGDAIGPPALAASAMEQGRRAMRHALGLPDPARAEWTPVGIYTIPEMACVGLDEAAARERHGDVLVGRAPFAELARGHIAGRVDGLLKLVAEPESGLLLGAQIVGEGAAELVHVGQMALAGGLRLEVFVDHVFNFPTLAEAYRVAALDALGQRAARVAAAG
jgi:NAD(P) transhydrogenase